MSSKSKSKVYDFIIVGGGVSGGYACRSFIKLGLPSVKSLCMIGSENVLPYERPTLAHGFLLKKDLEPPLFNILRKPLKYYAANNITIKLSTTVTNIDYDQKIVQTNKGESIGYKKLLLATGGRAVKFTDFLPDAKCKFKNIYYLRDLNDARILKQNVRLADNKNKHCVVIGGGYIGMEVTSSLVKSGAIKKITMLFPEQHMMAANRLFNDQIAAKYHDLYEKNGVEFICYSNDIFVTSFEGDKDGNVKCLNLKNGIRITCEIVIVGIGARPNVGLFKDTLEMSDGTRGLKVNRYLQSVSDSDVYGCGDIISFRNTNLNRTVRLEHVRHARHSGTYAMKAMSGKLNNQEKIHGYEFLPVFFSRVFGQSWIFYGNIGDMIQVDFKFVVEPNSETKVYFQDVKANNFKNDRMFRLLAIWIKRKTGEITGMLVDSDHAHEKAFAKQCVIKKRNIKEIPNFIKLFVSSRRFAKAKL